MTFRTVDILAIADEALLEARIILDAGVFRQAARLACQAQDHAAQAFILALFGIDGDAVRRRLRRRR